MNIIDLAAELVEKREGKSIDELYDEGRNFLLVADVETPGVEAGQFSLKVDIADYRGASNDGEKGVVTVYPGVEAALSVGVMPVNLGVVEYRFPKGTNEDLYGDNKYGFDVDGPKESSASVLGYGIKADESGEGLLKFDTEPFNITAAAVSAEGALDVPKSFVRGLFVATDADLVSEIGGKIASKIADFFPDRERPEQAPRPDPDYLADTDWSVAAVDEAGNDFGGSKLHFSAQTPDDDGSGYVLEGAFNWKGSNGSYGKETFIGELEGHELELVGQSIVQPAKGLATATYTGTLSEDWSQIENGQWSEDGTTPGQWSAALLV